MFVLTFLVITVTDSHAANMPRKIVLLFLFAYGSCMEMKETVERMVMVRTTGSDLQPAATGYIYKKESDGAASVIKMGESEVMEHLSKVYEQPKSFEAPIPVAAGPFYGKEDEDKAASFSSESKVIPIVEVQDDQTDGIANENDGNVFGEYASDFGNYKSDFDEYLKSLGYFEDGLYHEHGDGKDYGEQEHRKNGDKEHEGYRTKHNFEKGGAGDYHSEKYETYHASAKGGGHKDYDDADSFGKHYANGHGYKGGDHGYKTAKSQGEAVDGFHKLFDKNEYKKDHDFYDGEALKGGFHKYDDGRAFHGSGAGKFEKGGSHDGRHEEAHFGKDDLHDKFAGEEQASGHAAKNGWESFKHLHGDFAAEDGTHDGKSYGYEIKH